MLPAMIMANLAPTRHAALARGATSIAAPLVGIESMSIVGVGRSMVRIPVIVGVRRYQAMQTEVGWVLVFMGTRSI